MITVIRKKDSTKDTAGNIRLSNDVDVWFGEAFRIKTIEEAQSVADTLLEALNQFEYFGFDSLPHDKVSIARGYNGEHEHVIDLHDVYTYIVESGLNEYPISEDDCRYIPASQVLKDNPDIFARYYEGIILPTLK